MSGEAIVVELVSIVANNGNYLLNIGPKADGTIPEAQRRNLLDAGEWIKSHGDGIFGTQYWRVTQHSGQFRYATKPNAFFIHHIGQPGQVVTVTDPVPWMEGDVVTIVGGSMDGTTLNASKNQDGNFVINLSDELIGSDKYVWTFKITYATA
jgi:alpha-L-fucosidase